MEHIESEAHEVQITEEVLKNTRDYTKGYTIVPILTRKKEPDIGQIIPLRDGKWYRDITKAYLAIKTSITCAIVKDNADGKTGTVVAIVRSSETGR